MKGLTMLTVLVNALVQQEELVTVITFFYYLFKFTEFPAKNWNVHNSKR